MSYTTTLRDAAMLSSVFTALLCFYLPKRGDMTARKAAAYAGFGLLMMTPVHMLYRREEMLAYLYMLIAYAAMCIFARLWSRKPVYACMQRALSVFLLTDCVMLSISHVSFVSVGHDVFRASPLHQQLPALALLLLLCALPLMFLRRILPQEPCADANSLWLSILATVPYLFVSQITIWLPITSSDLSIAVPITVCASCILALMLILSMEGRLSAERARRDMLSEHHLMQMQRQKYEMSKSSQETVRRNYHDMKNLLLYLENADSRDDVRAHIASILEEIRPYEAVLDTGSEAMDILLGEKLSVCQREKIACTVMADGAALSFIKPLDLVAMLGNAMDNAIEACRRMPENASRYIQVRTAMRQRFVLLLVRNSCTGELNIQGERFVTTKEDRENHGFGLVSIEHTVQSYGGEMSCLMEDGEFLLTMIFPKKA